MVLHTETLDVQKKIVHLEDSQIFVDKPKEVVISIPRDKVTCAS